MKIHLLSFRNDLYVSHVVHAAHSITYSPSISNWTMFWSGFRPNFYKLPPSSCEKLSVNHIPGLTIPLKQSLQKLSLHMRTTCKLPQTRVYLHANSEILETPGQWITKGIQHRNVKLYTGKKRSNSVLYQQRIQGKFVPSTRRIFDIGVYVLIKSVSPLVYSIYNDWLLRVCVKDYISNDTILENDPTTFVVGKTYDTLFSFDGMKGYLRECNFSASCAMKQALRRQGGNVAFIDREIQKVIHCSLMYETKKSIQKKYTNPRFSFFELFRYDFLLNRSNNYPLLTEINMSPSLHPNYFENDGWLKHNIIKDVFNTIMFSKNVSGWTHYNENSIL